MSFIIQKASRTHIKPLICFFSESGCGKTYSSLLLARGLAGPSGKIVLGDSESGRGSLYADVLPGGFETFEITPPFSPTRYIEAVDTIEESGAAVGIIDSGSHEWEGIGSVLDMAAENETRSGKAGLHNWRVPKFEHAKFVQRLLRTKIPFVICLRAKYKSRQTKNDQGKTVIIKDEETSPIQAEDFIFEMTCHAEILQDHSFRLTKVSHPSLRDCFPVKGPITIETGERLAQWCASPGGAPSPKSKPAPVETTGNLLTAIREATVEIHGWSNGMTGKQWSELKPRLDQWCWNENVLSDTEKLSELGAERLKEVLAAVTKKLTPPS